MAAPEVSAGAPEAMVELGAVVEWIGAAVVPPGGSIGAADCWLEALEKPPGLAEPGADPSAPGESLLMTGVAIPEGVTGVDGPRWRSGSCMTGAAEPGTVGTGYCRDVGVAAGAVPWHP